MIWSKLQRHIYNLNSKQKNSLTLVVNHDSTESWFTTFRLFDKVVSKLTCRTAFWRFDAVKKTGNFADSPSNSFEDCWRSDAVY